MITAGMEVIISVGREAPAMAPGFNVKILEQFPLVVLVKEDGQSGRNLVALISVNNITDVIGQTREKKKVIRVTRIWDWICLYSLFIYIFLSSCFVSLSLYLRLPHSLSQVVLPFSLFSTLLYLSLYPLC